MTAPDVSDAELLDRIHQAFFARGWDDRDDAAGKVLDAIRASNERTLKGIDIDAVVPPSFLERNGVAQDRVERLLRETIGELWLARPRDTRTIIYPEDIDSFSRISAVSVQEVATIASPLLTLTEKHVKELLLGILGEREAENDWGGELSDAFNTNVRLGRERVATSFVLKGPSQRGRLTPARYGKNGDQITRAFKQQASLWVIQANARLDDSISDLVNGLVLDARSKGNGRAVATLWDGTDTARILAAYGKIDAATGKLL